MNRRQFPAAILLMNSLVAAWAVAVENPRFEDVVARLDDHWRGEIVAQVDQSYVGWDVEIGDADNDGKNEILATGCPDSRLYLFKKEADKWRTALLADNLAHRRPAMGLMVKVVDLNRDGKNEIIVGTGQEKLETAWFHVLTTEGQKLTGNLALRAEDCNKSPFTHGLAAFDVNGDGILEVFAAYCGYGEIIRYDVDRDLKKITARKVHQLSGSGEESLIADIDNDDRPEYLTCNGFRDNKARVEIFDFDAKGELAPEPRVIIEGFEGNKCFYCSLVVGDVDNDGKNELIVGWKREQTVNKSTVIGYRIAPRSTEAKPLYRFAHEDEALDLGYFEKMMAVADANHDGKKELIVSTRGDEMSERISSKHLGHIFAFHVDSTGNVRRELVAKLNPALAESSWVAVGDADNDGRNDIVVTTGKGNREKPGTSYVLLLKPR